MDFVPVFNIMENYRKKHNKLMKPGHFNLDIYNQIPYELDRVNYVLSRDDFCKENFDEIRGQFLEDFFFLIEENKEFDAVSAQNLIYKYCEAI